ncbi:MAG: hypothetical protein HQ481_03620 [Alphaproteobacteria bacterium]|nr:hypothetical protein [Alphaproteobacteria bacterium]
MTAALLASPITWIVAGIAALAGAIYLIVQHWDPIRAWLLSFWEPIRAAFDQGFVEGVLEVLARFSPVTLVAEAVRTLVQWLTGVDLFALGSEWAGRLWDGLRDRWAAMQAWLRDAVAGLTEWMPEWVKAQLGIDLTANIAAHPALDHGQPGAASGGAASSRLLPDVMVLPPVPPEVGVRAEVRSAGDALGAVARAPTVPATTPIAMSVPRVGLPQWVGAATDGGPSGPSFEAAPLLVPNPTLPAAPALPALSAIPIPTGPLDAATGDPSSILYPGARQAAAPTAPAAEPPSVSITIAEGAVRIALDGAADPDRLAAAIEDHLASVARRAASEARAALHD